MNVNKNVSLKPFHTFGMDVPCSVLATATKVQDYIDIYQNSEWVDLPKIVLGKGSNVLFTEPYNGVVIINQLLGKVITESDEFFHLEVQAGEDWPSLVEWTLEQGIGGLENLALIPGCAGSAPIQNIGAYGVEFKDVCEYVDYLDLERFTIQRLFTDQCEFGYRDSIFKQALLDKVVIIAVGLKLGKNWSPNVSYGPLKNVPEKTPKAIFDLVCDVRRSKLPDPVLIGNAGSFFKNPIITDQHYQTLRSTHPELNGYKAADGVKVAAGWLIDQCGLKGMQMGGAQVHPLQALVLINTGTAIPRDVIDLAWFIKQSVWDKYQIDLEHEVRFFGEKSETNLSNICNNMGS